VFIDQLDQLRFQYSWAIVSIKRSTFRVESICERFFVDARTLFVPAFKSTSTVEDDASEQDTKALTFVAEDEVGQGRSEEIHVLEFDVQEQSRMVIRVVLGQTRRRATDLENTRIVQYQIETRRYFEPALRQESVQCRFNDCKVLVAVVLESAGEERAVQVAQVLEESESQSNDTAQPMVSK
jgi:hypothetical protein